MDKQINDCDRIVLFAKQPRKTSFSSLWTIKHALGTKKVGHTGTLDSFASGLLVVCAGKMTKMAGKITAFDKTYEAVIKFGAETDTLECTGKVTKTAPLPTKAQVENAIKKWTGEILQKPPAFSSIHVNGKRASDIARSGKNVDLPERQVTVFSSEIKDWLVNDENLVEAVLVNFHVSKGTYIRSLARDIGKDAESAAHLIALRRTKVGEFCLENAAGYKFLKAFNIENALKECYSNKVDSLNILNNSMEKELQQEVLEKAIKFLDIDKTI